jgi:hypothetical protein
VKLVASAPFFVRFALSASYSVDCGCGQPVVDPWKWTIPAALDATYADVKIFSGDRCNQEFIVSKPCYPENPLTCSLLTEMPYVVPTQLNCNLLKVALDDMKLQCWQGSSSKTANCALTEYFGDGKSLQIARLRYDITIDGQ